MTTTPVSDLRDDAALEPVGEQVPEALHPDERADGDEARSVRRGDDPSPGEQDGTGERQVDASRTGATGPNPTATAGLRAPPGRPTPNASVARADHERDAVDGQRDDDVRLGRAQRHAEQPRGRRTAPQRRDRVEQADRRAGRVPRSGGSGRRPPERERETNPSSDRDERSGAGDRASRCADRGRGFEDPVHAGPTRSRRPARPRGAGRRRRAPCRRGASFARSVRAARSAPTKLRDEVARRVRHDLARACPTWAICAPFSQDHDLVAEQERLVDVVRDEHDRLAELALQPDRSSSCSSLRTIGSTAPNGSSISRMLRVGGEAAGDADALLLTAGELARGSDRRARGRVRRRRAARGRCARACFCGARRSSTGTVATLSTTVKWGSRPAFCMHVADAAAQLHRVALARSSSPSIEDRRRAVGSTIRLIMRSSVVLPQPDEPTKTVVLWAGSTRLKSSTATVPSANRFVTDRNSIDMAPSGSGLYPITDRRHRRRGLARGVTVG